MQTLQEWLLTSPLGKYILKQERNFYTNNVKNMFGKYSLQIGMDKINLLLGNKIVNHYNIPSDIIAKAQFLPIASDSIDLIVLSHYLEIYNDYEQIIGECERILSPNGKIIISCLNKSSFIGLFQKRAQLSQYHFLTVEKLESSLKKSGLNTVGGKFFSYTPPTKSNITLRRLEIFNKIGDRWFPTLANSFTLIASKNVITPNTQSTKAVFQKNKNSELAPICKN